MSVTLLTPYSVKTRIQATSGSKTRKAKLSMIAVFMKIFKEEGLAGLYRGFGATMLNTFSMRASTVS